MYKIIASSRYGVEVVDETDSIKDAEYLVREYQLAFGPEFSVYYR